MRTFDVYHRLKPDFMGLEECWEAHLYEKVAVVECEMLSDVFSLTNHIDWAWYENDEIVWHKDNPRSTSVGDVVFEIKIGEDAIPMMVSNIGYKELKTAM